MFSDKNFVAFLGIILIIAMSSCDPHGGYEYWIDNQSDSILFVSYREYYPDSIKTKELETGEIYLLTQFSTHGGLYD